LSEKTKTRIHMVCTQDRTRLVRAATKNAAIRHVAKDIISATVASQNDLVALLSEGVEVEDASPEEGEQPPLVESTPLPTNDQA
jgi:hypothetical protein